MDKNSAIPCHSLHNRAKSIYCTSTTYVSIRAKIVPKEGSTPSLGTMITNDLRVFALVFAGLSPIWIA